MGKFFLVLFITVFLTGCSSVTMMYHQGPHDDYKIIQGKYTLDNAGIVIGYITGQRHFGLGLYDDELPLGRAFVIKDLISNKQIVYGFAKEFQIMLPPGKYEFYGMGNPTGHLLIPKDNGFKFTVEQGQIIYIGSIVGDRDLKQYQKGHIHSAPVAYAIYAPSSVMTLISYFERHEQVVPNEKALDPEIEFFVIDEREQIINQFKSQFPEYKTYTIDTKLMTN